MRILFIYQFWGEAGPVLVDLNPPTFGGRLRPCLRLQAGDADPLPSDYELWTGPTPKNFTMLAGLPINICFVTSLYLPSLSGRNGSFS